MPLHSADAGDTVLALRMGVNCMTTVCVTRAQTVTRLA